MAGIKIGYVAHPKELTDADWQKKKGLIGKAKKTGIGAKLDAAQTLHGKIDFANLSAGKDNPADMDALKDGIKAAKDYYAKFITPYSKSLDDIQKQAEGAKKDIKKLPMSGPVIKAMDAIIKAAGDQRVAMKSFDLEADIKDVTDRIVRRQELAAKFLTDSIKKFLVGAKKFLADPTPESWNDNIKQNGRSVSNSVKELKAYNAEFWKDFQKFGGFDLGNLGIDTKSEDFGKTTTKLIKKALEQVKAIATFKP